MESRKLKVNFTGVSGVGKTQISKWLANELNIPFISGSYSDLVPQTKNIPHRDMILKTAEEIQAQDTQVLNLRNKLFASHDAYVSDRSYLDSAAYFINKLSHRIPECEVENFLEICRALTGVQISHLIFIPFTYDYVKNWQMEDNSKRVLNRYYQWEVSTLMYRILYEIWGVSSIQSREEYVSGYIQVPHQKEVLTTHLLILRTMDYKERQDIIREWLDLKK